MKSYAGGSGLCRQVKFKIEMWSYNVITVTTSHDDFKTKYTTLCALYMKVLSVGRQSYKMIFITKYIFKLKYIIVSHIASISWPWRPRSLITSQPYRPVMQHAPTYLLWDSWKKRTTKKQDHKLLLSTALPTLSPGQ